MPLISGGGGSFNGGTITQPLVIALATGGQDALEIRADPTDPTTTFFTVNQFGNLTIQSGGTHQQATLQLVDTTPGNPGTITLDTFTGVGVSIEGSAQNALHIDAQTGQTGDLIRVRDASLRAI